MTAGAGTSADDGPSTSKSAAAVGTRDPKNQPWIEKYRPQTLDDVAANKEIIDTIKRLTDENRLPHLLLYGPPGVRVASADVLAVLHGWSWLHSSAARLRSPVVKRTTMHPRKPRTAIAATPAMRCGAASMSDGAGRCWREARCLPLSDADLLALELGDRPEGVVHYSLFIDHC
jgi:hypothetical protein